jgi:hypothetical protein
MSWVGSLVTLERFGHDDSTRSGLLSINDVVMAAICTYNDEAAAQVVRAGMRDLGFGRALSGTLLNTEGEVQRVAAPHGVKQRL